jgi:dihydroxyacetone kinase-like protein
MSVTAVSSTPSPVGGGPDKVAAIRGMLKGGFANILITDEDTARAVIAA